ncbi:addiction module protein [Thiothrix unzii]|uniref:Addiction module protein n=1 Tax=Thiothrix unzii TaxID=111769 RepID=A0A975II53_9GAMM|nr:addiction module protein [Thiothrix unzii]QTR54577.1 addiction module protein [Thiothrix unzii]
MIAWSLDTLPLERMTLADKLALIERVWESLTQKNADFASPTWHGELLRSRLAAAENGAVAFRPLDEVKQRLRRPTAP